MPPSVALALTLFLIAFLFWRDAKAHPGLSRALWIPLLWFFIFGTRNLSGWLTLGANRYVGMQGYQEGNSLDRNFLLIVIVLSIIVLARRRADWRGVLRENRVLAFFLLYCLLSIAWSDFPMVAFKRLIKFAGSVPILLIILTERSPRDAALAVLRRVSYLIICLSVLFIRYFPQYGRLYHPWSYEVFYSGACDYKNALGVACIVAFFIFLYELTRRLRDTPKPLAAIETWTALIMLAMSAYLTRIAQSATATSCIAAGVVLMLGTQLPAAKRRPGSIGAWIVGLVVLAGVVQTAFDIKEKLIALLGRDPSITQRVPLWNQLLKMVDNPVLGTGYESFWTIDRLAYLFERGFPALQSHNGYIDTYINLGLVGLAFFVALILTHFRRVTREFVRDYDFGRIKLAFLVAFLMFNYTEAAFPRLTLLLMIFLLFMIDVPEAAMSAEEEPGPPPPAGGSERRFSPLGVRKPPVLSPLE